MKYVKHYSIEHDEIYQLSYKDDDIIPNNLNVSLTPFPDIDVRNDEKLVVHKIKIPIVVI